HALDDEIIFKINLNPADVETLRGAKSTLVSDSSRIENCEIVPDSSVERGFCVLSSSVGIVDARLRTQLDMLKKSLLDAVKEEGE
ncbi:MAG: FliH/SctL family protein, partial [FCB group bacterium]